MSHLNRIVSCTIEWVIGFSTGAIVLILLIGVILRYLFNAPLFWAEEVVVLALIWITFLGGILLVRDDKNVAITVVTDQLPPPLARMVCLLGDILVLGMIVVMLWLSWRLSNRLSMSTTPALRMSEFWYGAAMIAGFAGMAFFQFQRVARGLRTLFDRGGPRFPEKRTEP